MRIQESFAKQGDLPRSEHSAYEGLLTGLGDIIGGLGSIPGVFCCPNPYKTVQQGEVGLISRFGKWYRSVDPGLWRVNVITEKMKMVDIKIQVDDIPRQSIMTKDNVMVIIDSVLYWHVTDPYTTAFLVSNVRTALIERTQTTLRQILGQRVLQECIENRETIAHEVQNIIEVPAEQWGVRVESMLIKDLQFSPELQETLSAAAKQKRIGESKVIAAQAEVNAAKLMREASDILNTPAAMQIRYLETLTSMASKAGSKVSKR
ncbi:hypothetical protein M427DRAFT_100579 [Gonapodya prolifera JEL478]|uniref:Band 7 domain-containing protein n=1 Tax=Gonapodya prolifera (strain JEL478) TaxID=1344416 RepID=A0A139A9N0_GONPJ|nr:hypothetical protein M427DRAFT_100579 [Gonapodya prolifera JEL478]|eukprot:KXS13384.1 hypothetical protein M427DRAFT_100579 [Gonapodya prolifera JEL478]